MVVEYIDINLEPLIDSEQWINLEIHLEPALTGVMVLMGLLNGDRVYGNTVHGC